MDQKDLGMTEALLSARGLVKRFGRVVALDHCDFDLYPGEILGLIGDNGAGKSTLIKALCGAMSVDAGEIWLEGKPVSFRSPMEAREGGSRPSIKPWRSRRRSRSPTTCSSGASSGSRA